MSLQQATGDDSPSMQQPFVQVSDAKAMQAIFIKEQHIYEESIQSVFATWDTLASYGTPDIFTHRSLRLMLGPGLLATLGESYTSHSRGAILTEC